jgi:hypothetical protein
MFYKRRRLESDDSVHKLLYPELIRGSLDVCNRLTNDAPFPSGPNICKNFAMELKHITLGAQYHINDTTRINMELTDMSAAAVDFGAWQIQAQTWMASIRFTRCSSPIFSDHRTLQQVSPRHAGVFFIQNTSN